MAFIPETKRSIIGSYNDSDPYMKSYASEYHNALLKWEWDERKTPDELDKMIRSVTELWAWGCIKRGSNILEEA